jgi:hypothetical protein
MVRVALFAMVGFVVGAATGCGSNRPAAVVPSLVGPHCAANEAAAAHEQESQQQNPPPSQPPASASAFPAPAPTTGSPPPLPTPMPTAVPVYVAAATLHLGEAELSRYPSSQYVVRVGTVVDVELPDESAPFCWSAPTSSEPSVLAVVSAVDQFGGGAHAQFRALAAGVATVGTTNACYTFPPCGAPIAITEAVVTVRSG